MNTKPRPMKKYTPRRRRSCKDLQKQQIIDLEHLLEMDLSSYLVLKEEGTEKQIQKALAKMRTDLSKYGAEMEAISRDLGEGFPELATNYVRTFAQIVQAAATGIDKPLLDEHQKQGEILKRAAAPESAAQS